MIRHWARYQSITSSNPGYWITNFPLTLLVVYFLQSRPKPIVPSFDYLQSLAGKNLTFHFQSFICFLFVDLHWKKYIPARLIIIMASNIALISVTQWRRFNFQYFPARYCGASFLKYEMKSFYIAANQTRNRNRNTRAWVHCSYLFGPTRKKSVVLEAYNDLIFNCCDKLVKIAACDRIVWLFRHAWSTHSYILTTCMCSEASFPHS